MVKRFVSFLKKEKTSLGFKTLCCRKRRLEGEFALFLQNFLVFGG